MEDNRNLSDINYIKTNIKKILEELANNTLVPSYEIFFWTLFLADIDHFGNDYNFFHRLADFALKEGFISRGDKAQLTEHNQDCQNIIQFEKDRSFSCFLRDGGYVIRKNNPVKSSRISSLTSLYCHLGRGLGDLIRNILRNKTLAPEIIKMGESIL